MKLDPVRFGLATAVVFAVVWVICSILVVVIPSFMMDMSGHMLHADLGMMNWSMRWIGFVIGLVLWTVFPGLLAWAVAAVYNRLIPSAG